MRPSWIYSLFVATWLACAAVGTVTAQGVRIADLVAQAANGDTVRVAAGIYTEPVIALTRPVTLLGEPGTRIVGNGDHELMVISGANVTVSGFSFEHVELTFMEDRSAVRIQDARACTLSGNTFSDVFFAVYLARAEDCRIEANAFVASFEKETSGGNAIHAWYSQRLRIAGNSIHGFRDGIYLEFTDDSIVTDNTSRNNVRYGLHFMFSDRNTYERNVFSDNRAGVAVMYANGISMHDNVFERAWGSSAYGLLLKEIKDGDVTGNIVSGNSVGMFLEATDRMQFTGNTFSENGWAIKLMASAADNLFSGNIFRGNTFDVATNSRTATSTFLGNFWDRYGGYDLDKDGIGDVPYRPVTLFSVLAERHEPMLYLYRSVLVDVLDAAESLFPILTPVDLVDDHPLTSPAS